MSGAPVRTISAALVGRDPWWDDLRHEAAVWAHQEPALGRLVRAAVLEQGCLMGALADILARALASKEVPAALLRQLFDGVIAAKPGIAAAVRADLAAVCERDPACKSPLKALMFYKGFQALQAYRLAHALLYQGRREIARYLHSRMVLVFGVDIHPAARVGCGIMIDHGNGVVIGETAVVEDGVSLLHEVTLGGTGTDAGERHPKIRQGVMIGAGAGVFGNIEVGERAKIGAGSIVVDPVRARCTAAGIPARLVGPCANQEPAREMDQSFGDA
jgi:serine O-acetyltransferase